MSLMKNTAAIIATSSFGSSTTFPLAGLSSRALPLNAPHGYEPQVSRCPSSSPTIRDATSLSKQEEEWLEIRRNATLGPMREFLARLDIQGLDTISYLNGHQDDVPIIGIAISGGGYRAMLNGAGVVQAFDDRTEGSTTTGHLGGLLQSSTYLAGLSGGSWLVGSLYVNNFTSISDILDYTADESSLWQFGNSIFEGPDSHSIQLLDTVDYYASIIDAVHAKRKAGFDTSLTDYWGRALSYQLINATDGGPGYTFSSISKQQWFQDAKTPLPFIVADGRAPGEIAISTNTTVFSINPWELGSHDPTVYAFAPLEYIGTEFDSGRPRDRERCVTGFDSASFIMGTSSSLFNEGLLLTKNSSESHGFKEFIKTVAEESLEAVSDAHNDVSYVPNPFHGYREKTNPGSTSRHLNLVDGGEDKQNIPLNPLIQPERQVDVIFAVDSSADTDETWPTSESSANWPSGAAIEATYRRSLTWIQNGTSFPSIPSVNTFLNLGLNNNPTFFGCNASNFTDNFPPPPLIVYLPNAPYVHNSNVSTFDPAYDTSERNLLVLNGYNLATQGNSTLDKTWPTCVGCAILARSLERTHTSLPDVCSDCFERYCWDGTINDQVPGHYVPAMKFQEAGVKNAGSKVGKNTMLLTFLVLGSVSLLL